MQLRQLQCFVAAAELENFTSASERLHMSQSALSRQIANLEGELGLSLFERAGQKVSLSAAGLKLKSSAQMLLAASEAFTASARSEIQDTLSGTVTMVAAPSQGGLLFPRLVSHLATEHPKLKLRFIEAKKADAEALVQDGEADFALITCAEAHGDLTLSPLFLEALYVYHPSPLSVHLGCECSLAEALALPLIMPDSARERHFFETHAARCGVTLNIVYESNQHHLAVALANVAEGVILLPATAVFDQRLNQLHPVSQIRDLTMATFLVSRAAQPASPAMAEVERLLRLDIANLQSKGVVR